MSYPGPALRSPCYACETKRRPVYPECCSACKSLNSYLIHLGDKPHTVSKVPKEMTIKTRNYRHPVVLCSFDEFKQVANFVKEYKSVCNFLSKQMAVEVGCSVELINSILRDGQRRMGADTYQKFQRWMEALEAAKNTLTPAVDV